MLDYMIEHMYNCEPSDLENRINNPPQYYHYHDFKVIPEKEGFRFLIIWKKNNV